MFYALTRRVVGLTWADDHDEQHTLALGRKIAKFAEDGRYLYVMLREPDAVFVYDQHGTFIAKLNDSNTSKIMDLRKQNAGTVYVDVAVNMAMTGQDCHWVHGERKVMGDVFTS